MQTLTSQATALDRATQRYSADPGAIAYVYACRRDDIARGVEQAVAIFASGERVALDEAAQ